MALPKRPVRSEDSNKNNDDDFLVDDTFGLSKDASTEDSFEPEDLLSVDNVAPSGNSEEHLSIDSDNEVSSLAVSTIEEPELAPFGTDTIGQDGVDVEVDIHDIESIIRHETQQDYSGEYKSGEIKRTAPMVKPETEEKVQKAYQDSGEITVDQALNESYELYRHLEGPIQDMTTYVQEVMREKGWAERVGKARKARGTEQFRDMASEIDRLVVRRINSGEAAIQPIDAKHFIAAVKNEILGFGPLEPLWQDNSITEIMVNGPYKVRVESKGRIRTAKGVQFRDADHLLGVAVQMLAMTGRRVDVNMPYADASLPDGSRINVIHPEIAPDGPYLTIRRFPDTVFSLRKLVDVGSMDEQMAEVIGNLVYHGASTLIVGGTGSGKTSSLNALSGCIPDNDRVITIEDTLELRLNSRKDVISMRSRPASPKGEGAVTIRDLVRNSLRMRPDRVVVGEVRDASAYDMMQAMNTGHEGSLTTVHANDAPGAIERVSLLVSEAGEVTPDRALSLIAGGVDILLIIKRYEDGSRRVRGIYEVPSHLESKDGKLELNPVPLWEFIQDSSDEDEKVRGHYEEINKISESLTRKHSLDKRKHLTIDELYELSKVEGE